MRNGVMGGSAGSGLQPLRLALQPDLFVCNPGKAGVDSLVQTTSGEQILLCRCLLTHYGQVVQKNSEVAGGHRMETH